MGDGGFRHNECSFSRSAIMGDKHVIALLNLAIFTKKQ